MKKLILPVLVCTLIAFTFTSFSFQTSNVINAQDNIVQPVIDNQGNIIVNQSSVENETDIIFNEPGVVAGEGVIEPGGNLTLWFKASGGGYIYENGYKNNFGFNICYNNTLEGHVNYVDRAGGYHFKSIIIENASVEVKDGGYLIKAYGVGEIQGQRYLFRLEAADKGEPGVSDTFNISIYMESGFLYDCSGGVIGGGNININI